MMAWKHSSIVRIVLFLVAVCLLSFPAQARYSGGSGTADDPYQIATAADLIGLGNSPQDYDKYFILTADIDLDPNVPGRRVFAGAVIGGPPVQADPPVPEAEGYQGTPFTGVLDGNDHEIGNLVIEAPWSRPAGPTAVYVGLIAQIGEKGQVKRLGLRNVSIDGESDVGAVAGENRGTVLSCHSSGRVTGNGSIGGLVGCNQGGTIVACHSAGSVQGSSVGGLVGLNAGGTISSSYSSSSVVKDKHRGDIAGTDYAGGLVGYSDGTISSSYSSGDVTGDVLTGGLVGYNFGTISSCYSSSNVMGGSSAGGLVGENGGGILSCYSTGNVSGAYGVGGLVGEDNVGGIITSYSTGRVTGKKYVGGLIGQGSSTSVYFSYWAIEASGLKESAGGEGKTAQQMMSRGTFAGWGRKAQWVLEDGKDCPHLTWEGRAGVPITDSPHPYGGGTGDPNDPYLVRTADDFARIGRFPADWDASFELVDDIDMAAIDPNKLLPIGTIGLPFAGRFDGRSHTVRSFNGSSWQGGLTGVFGWIGASGTVRDLHLKDVVISQGLVVGGLAGCNEGTIFACSTMGRVSGSFWAGGMVGENRGTVASSCATCDVSEERGAASVGGLVGANRATVSSCYAMGTAQGYFVGGLVGVNEDGTIIASYSTAAVKAEGPIIYRGGLVGRVIAAGPVNSRGRPSGRSVERKGSEYGTVTASFWDMQTSGCSEVSGGTGLPTSEMQKAATFLNVGWDFVGETANGMEDIWWIDEGKDYPRLWWETPGE